MKTTALQSSAADSAAVPVTAIKGTRQDLTCRGYQYELGETYRHDGPVVRCGDGGFHAIEGHPLEVFSCYPPAKSRYFEVECNGEIARDDEDSKIASAEITFRTEIHLPELVQRAIQWVFERAKWSEGAFVEGKHEGATASGFQGAATASGDQGAATASGCWGAATASGDQGAATASGDQGAATASGFQGAATASGFQGAATASGRWGAATASGRWGAATASGFQGKARGKPGNALFLVERDDDGHIAHVWAGIVGRDGIAEDTWYRLQEGQPVVVDEE